MRTCLARGAALAVSLVLLAATPVTAQAASATASGAPASIHAVPIRSSYETATRQISRDIGVSVVLPDGHELWLFGDTAVYQRNNAGGWTGLKFIDGSTALEARFTRGQVPHGGEYPSGTPTRFIPVPKHVYFTDGSGRPCVRGIGNAAFAARWPTGAVVMPSNTSQVLITYSEVCVIDPKSGAQGIPEGWGYLLYDWRTKHIDRGPIDVFAPQTDGAAIAASDLYGSPILDNGNLTLFSSSCTSQYFGCGSGQVSSVTMPATTDALDKPTSYTPTQLATDAPGSWQPLSISVDRYSTGLRLIEWTSITGTYNIFTAPTLGTLWHLDQSATLPGCHTHTGFCFALEGHPELSTPTETYVSYLDPDAGPGMGHIVISAVPT